MPHEVKIRSGMDGRRSPLTVAELQALTRKSRPWVYRAMKAGLADCPHIPRERIGHIICDSLAPQSGRPAVTVPEILIEPELVLRDSTGPALERAFYACDLIGYANFVYPSPRP